MDFLLIAIIGASAILPIAAVVKVMFEPCPVYGELERLKRMGVTGGPLSQEAVERINSLPLEEFKAIVGAFGTEKKVDA